MPTTVIREEIQKGGTISFARFMELALYCPETGYYERNRDNVGRAGDFITSVSVGSFFGELLAFQFAEWLEEMRIADCKLRMVEAGAHDGKLAADLLGWLKQFRPELFAQVEYVILEPSRSRQQWQRETLASFPNVRWLDALPDAGFAGIIFSNELLDAFPVRRFGWDAKEKKWFEWGVTLDGEKFSWARLSGSLAPTGGEGRGENSPNQGSRFEPLNQKETFNAQHSTSNVQGRTSGHSLNVECSQGFMGRCPSLPSSILNLPASLLEVLPDGYIVEDSPAAENWWRAAAGMLQRGKLLAIDYGFTAEEQFSPARLKGTLRAYHRHQVSDDLLAFPGEQDLTAHVNFSAIQSAGEAAGLRTETFCTQPQFLTRILGRAVKEKSFASLAPKQIRQFQALTHPEHLGRAFRVLVQSR